MTAPFCLTLSRRAALAGGLGLAAPALGQPRQAHRAPLVGVYLGPGAPAAARLPQFETTIGRRVDFVSVFTDYTSPDTLRNALRSVRTTWGRGVIGRPILANIGMFPLRPGRGEAAAETPAGAAGGARPRHPGASLRATADGVNDALFAEVAGLLVQAGHPDATVRLGWEFNGDWMPWTAAHDPANFVNAFRRIVRVLRASYGARFKFDWCLANGHKYGPPERAYPGDDVVDTIGLDIYNLTNPPIAAFDARWRFFRERPYGLDWHRDFAAEHRKPRSFPEWGTGKDPRRPRGHGDDPRFIRAMLDWMREGEAAAFMAYWDNQAHDFDGQISQGAMPQAAAAFRQALSNWG